MKLQLLYVLVFAAPLLARLLSPEPSTPPTATEPAETAPVKAEVTEPAPKTDSRPAAAPAKDTKKSTPRSSLRGTPAVPTYAFL